jgi:hypothetical protein
MAARDGPLYLIAAASTEIPRSLPKNPEQSLALNGVTILCF